MSEIEGIEETKKTMMAGTVQVLPRNVSQVGTHYGVSKRQKRQWNIAIWARA